MEPEEIPEEITAYVDAVMVEFIPVLRAAVNTWERLGVVAPAPEELVEMLMQEAFGGSTRSDDGER